MFLAKLSQISLSLFQRTVICKVVRQSSFLWLHTLPSGSQPRLLWDTWSWSLLAIPTSLSPCDLGTPLAELLVPVAGPDAARLARDRGGR